MAAYHQMGHHSRNLVLEESDLVAYRGAILSPVNEVQADMATFLERLQAVPDFETIFDPQLYYPRAERETLRHWPYFPRDVDTADTANDAWWRALTDNLLTVCQTLGVKAICTPAQVPTAYTNGYYASCIHTARYMHRQLQETSSRIRGLQSAVVSLPDLAAEGRALAIASIISQTPFDRVYVVFAGGPDPRRELDNADQLKGAMRMIAALNESGLRVLVGYTSTDVLLWKVAGAHDCASGKFFNLRRFTGTRFEDPAGGGGQLGYLVEENLVAFLRGGDIPRVDAQGMVSDATRANPYYAQIQEGLVTGDPWVAVSWRLFLYWFAEVQDRIETGLLDVRTLLREAENRWTEL
ncbi:MAG: hypothetical protein JWO36_7423 [Myxococcales bacterium]|nr:hypothetical protein [Myxococcales bacterium]